MTVRKRNEYLEGSDSEGEAESGYDSDENEESRGGIADRARKRQRIDSRDEDDFASEDDLSEVDPAQVKDASVVISNTKVSEGASRNPEEHTKHTAKRKRPADPQLKPSTPNQVAAAQVSARKTGVVYISRVPPFMKPQTLKHFLAPHAPKGIGRIFLTPEDHAAHTRRVRSGGNKKKSFVDGWVEFTSKREAKIAVELLNGNIIGGKKGSFYHDDLWNMKYLNGFKWSHLTEQIANENAERAARMREEIRRTRQENKAFVADIEKGKMLEGMEIKRKAKAEVGGELEPGAKVKRARREFKQKAVQRPREHELPSEQVSRITSLIF